MNPAPIVEWGGLLLAQTSGTPGGGIPVDGDESTFFPVVPPFPLTSLVSTLFSAFSKMWYVAVGAVVGIAICVLLFTRLAGYIGWGSAIKLVGLFGPKARSSVNRQSARERGKRKG